MRKQIPTTGIVCSEYQRLLEESNRAVRIWDERRAEICRSSSVGKETGDELLRLQTKYARAYTLLRKHVQTCLRCQPLWKIA